MQEASKACHRTRQDELYKHIKIEQFETSKAINWIFYSADTNILHRDASTSEPNNPILK